MPKRARKNLNGSPVDGRTTTVFVRYLGTYTTVISGSTQFGQTIHPLNFGARAVEFCDLFEEYRLLDVKASFNATYSSATSNPVMSILGATPTENLTAAPTLAAQLAQFDTSHCTFLNQTMPVRVKLPKELLRGHQDWYSANNGTDAPAVWFGSGMSISTGLAVAGTLQVLWEMKIQFKGNSDPSVSISRRRTREKCEEFEDDSDDASIGSTLGGPRAPSCPRNKSKRPPNLVATLFGPRTQSG